MEMAPALPPRFPRSRANTIDSDTTSLPTERKHQSAFYINPAFAATAALPRPLLLPAFAAARNRSPPAHSHPSLIPRRMAPQYTTLPQPPAMTQPTPQHLIWNASPMPPPRSNRAPYFSGQVGDPIEDFLDEYSELADSCGLAEQQKVEAIIRYIPYSHRVLWKSLDGYVARDWTEFRANLEEIYDGPSVPSRHSEQRLLDFVRESSKSRMNDEADVLQYYRDFLALSKPLLDSQRLSIYERDKAFWLGFHPHDHSEMYTRLIAKHPDQPSSAYFDYLDVYRVARVTFT